MVVQLKKNKNKIEFISHLKIISATNQPIYYDNKVIRFFIIRIPKRCQKHLNVYHKGNN